MEDLGQAERGVDQAIPGCIDSSVSVGHLETLQFDRRDTTNVDKAMIDLRNHH